MRITDYSDFARQSDWTAAQPPKERERIAQYGIASEIGSLVSAVKKKVLLGGDFDWNKPNEEIVEELGDILWYVDRLAEISEDSLDAVLRHDLSSLAPEIEADNVFLDALGRAKFDLFLDKSRAFLDSKAPKTFAEYQAIAFLTARTQGQDLLHVCLTRLLFYATVILSKGFPQVEKLMQTDISKLPLKRVLAMLMWHVSALAELYDINLNEVAQSNRAKLNDLSNVDELPSTPLHDGAAEVPDSQRLPRQLTVSFVSTGKGRLQMFYDGHPLGDELTDNSIEDDGYRFHDSLHLANAGKLGWSPVLRSLLQRKRRFNPVLDNAQDGARAKIVEELIIKAIHSEGERIGGDQYWSNENALFTAREQIPFSLLRLIRRFAKGLEVERNRYWEWQEAILEGHRIYTALRREGQGTVQVDLDQRSLSFVAEVCPNVAGPVVGMGMAGQKLAGVDLSRLTGPEVAAAGDDDRKLAIAAARKEAILQSLSLAVDDISLWSQLSVSEVSGAGISVKASGPVIRAIWDRGVVAFQSVETILDHHVVSSVTAVASPPR